MNKMIKRILAAILVTSVLLGSNGISYAAETAAGDGIAGTEEVSQESEAGEQMESPGDSEESGPAYEESAATDTEEQAQEEAGDEGQEADAQSVEETGAEASGENDAAIAEDGSSEEETADAEALEDTDAAAAELTAEEAAAAAAQAQEEVFTAGELVYHGGDYDVTLAYDEAAKIPATAELKVREITKGTSEYESYLAGAEAAAGKGVAEARFFDITIWAAGTDGQQQEIQPQSPVRVSITYHSAIEVADEGEVQAMHFENGTSDAEVVSSDTNGGSEVSEIAFDAESFSVYGIIYTVDFTYDGYTFSMPGEGSIYLSELAEILGLYETDLDKAFSVGNVSDVSFTDYDLVKIEKQADGDWLLTSLAPFTSEETLTITMKDGVKFVIGVTDEQVSSNLTDFLTNAVITGATQDSEGKYEVEAGKEYNIILSFAESSAHQFDNRSTLTYTMPDGLTILSRQTGDLKINIVYKGRTYQVDATYDLDINGNLEIKFDENDPDFHHLENSTNVSFRFSYNGAFDGSEDKIHFSEDLERDIVFDEPEPGQAYVTKSGTFDEETGKFSYTITVNATGDVTNVNVKDVISGNALIFNNDVRVGGNSSSYRDNGAANGFDYTFASMQEGEVITITYSASVDFSKDDDKNGKISADQTKNTATVKPEDGEPHNSEYSREISFKTTSKSNGTEDGATADGDKIIKWTIEYNSLALASAAGDTIKDAIAASSTEYMKYYGNGINVEVFDHSGNLVRSSEVSYDALTSYTDESWTYTIPNSDTEPYRYVITYKTVVDMERVNGGGTAITLTNMANSDGGGIEVSPNNKVEITKNAESSSEREVSWVSHISVPEGGLTKAVVTDTYPVASWDHSIYDTFKDGSLEITGLLEGEGYTVTYNDKNLVITFFQDAPANRTPGLKSTPGGHTITVKLTTNVNQEWLQIGYKNGGYQQEHENTIDINGTQAKAKVILGKPGATKSGVVRTSDSNGNPTSFKFTVKLAGVTEEPITITDSFDTSLLELDDSVFGRDWNHEQMYIYGGDQYNQDKDATPVSYSETSEGMLITANSVPKQADGKFYPYYKISYVLRLKDGVDLGALAIANGGEYDVDNTAKWGDYESEFTYKVEYDYLDKKLLNAGELGGTNRTAQYQITFNPSKATLNEGSDMTMTDVLSANLSVDYSSINIVTDPSGRSVIYSLSGNDDGETIATYTIPDSTKVTITYDANVRGNGSQKIVNKVSVNGKEETVENTKSYGSASEGEGAQASFKIVKVDGYDANKKLQGVKFKVFCENPGVDFGGGVKELILVTDENGEITFDGDTYTFYFDEVYHVQEIEAPEDYGKISFDYLVTLTNVMSKVDYGHYIYYFSDSMQIKNWPLEGLVVEKQVESSDPADLEAYYNFRISVLNDDDSVNTDFNEKSGDDQFKNGVAEFQLKAGEQKMFWGFAKGTKYKVEEVDADGFVTTVTYSEYDEDGNVTKVNSVC